MWGVRDCSFILIELRVSLYCTSIASGDPDEVLSPKEEEKVQQTIASIEALANSYNVSSML